MSIAFPFFKMAQAKSGFEVCFCYFHRIPAPLVPGVPTKTVSNPDSVIKKFGRGSRLSGTGPCTASGSTTRGRPASPLYEACSTKLCPTRPVKPARVGQNHIRVVMLSEWCFLVHPNEMIAIPQATTTAPTLHPNEMIAIPQATTTAPTHQTHPSVNHTLLDLGPAPYVLYGVKYIDPAPLVTHRVDHAQGQPIAH